VKIIWEHAGSRDAILTCRGDVVVVVVTEVTVETEVDVTVAVVVASRYLLLMRLWLPCWLRLAQWLLL